VGRRNTKQPKLKAPHYPNGDEGIKYDIVTLPERLIHEHTGLNFWQIEDLDLVEYLLYFRDCMIYMLSQTENGKEYLEKCWLLEQTEPDKKRLRRKFAK